MKCRTNVSCRVTGWVATVAFICCTTVALAQLPPVPGASRDRAASPRLFVAERMKDLGLVIEGDKVPVEWILENRGKADLVIDKAKAACGCTVFELSEDQKIIAPGASLVLKAEFDTTRRRGDQVKSITIYSNDTVEPELKLEFTATIETLYETRPSSVLNLRTVQRGTRASRTLDIIPGKGQDRVDVVGVELSAGVPLDTHVEPYDVQGATGQHIYFDVQPGAALDRIRGDILVTLRVDGRQVQRTLSLRARVTGDLTWLPRVLDATRHHLTRGKGLAPISIRSANKQGFDILGVKGGPVLDVTYESKRANRPRAEYTIKVSIRSDAPPGPFGEQIEIRTSALDQPIVRIPVFGIISAPIEIDPPVILLRSDSTPKGSQRHIKIQANTTDVLEIKRMTCTSDAVSVKIDAEASARYQHIRFLIVTLDKPLSSGEHEFVLTVETNIDGATTLKIPVVIYGTNGSN